MMRWLALLLACGLLAGCSEDAADDAGRAPALGDDVTSGGGGSGGSGSGTGSGSPAPGAPTVTLKVNAPVGVAPFAAVFTVEATDPDGDPMSWTLDADGDYVSDWRSASPSPFPAQATFTYVRGAYYTATVTVTDGQSDVAVSVEVRVTDPRFDAMACDVQLPDGFGTVHAPSPNRVPFASMWANSTNGTVPLNVTFSLKGYDADADPLAWELDVDGDLRCDHSCPSPCAFPHRLTHNYTEPGTYHVTMVLSDGIEHHVARLTVTANAEEVVARKYTEAPPPNMSSGEDADGDGVPDDQEGDPDPDEDGGDGGGGSGGGSGGSGGR